MSFVFISYSRQDQAYVSLLVQVINSHNLPMWLNDHIDYGTTWPRDIQNCLEQCRVFVVVMSPRSEKSTWVQAELSLALELKKPIFPLLLEGHRWLSVAAVQSIDVTGGRLPPARFFDTLRSYFPATVTPGYTFPMQLTLRRTPRTAQGFVEPLLEVGSALPLHMVLVPGGTFLMGSLDDEPEREEREGPQHEVTLPSFLIGRYPVTQAQWRSVTALPQVNRELKIDPSRFRGDNRPVESVSWYDAVEFCARLSAHTGRQYRLPSEAEWEYACRAGTTTPFYFGNTLTTKVANYNGDSTYTNGPKGEYRGETTPVDHFGIANAFGLCDMHGNVDEWCQDYWHDSYEGAPTDDSAWIEGGNSNLRVRRGGSWHYYPGYCRSAYRDDDPPVNNGYMIGFRVVCSAPRALQRPTG